MILINIFNFLLISFFVFILFFSKLRLVEININSKILILMHLLVILILNSTFNNIAQYEGYAHYFPDQTKYMHSVIALRENIYLVLSDTKNFIYEGFYDESIWRFNDHYGLTSLQTVVAKSFKGSLKDVSSIFSFTPFIVLDNNITSIAYFNFILFLLIYITLIKDKLFGDKLQYIYLFIPSLLIFHSLALKDFLLVFLTFYFFYSFFNNKYFYTLVFLFFTFQVRFNLSIVLVIFIIVYYFIGISNYVSKKIFILLSSICAVCIFFLLKIYQTQILYYTNDIKKGFLSESGIYWNDSFFYNNYLDLIKEGSLKIWMVLIGKINYNPIESFSTIENMFMITASLHIFFKNKLYLMRAPSILLFTYLFYCFVLAVHITNTGAIHRYRTPLTLSLLFFMFYFNGKKNNLDSNNIIKV